mmetsp:Transcript_6096/g.14705  ORF Transcript_6096/g.14705 Transcript_6096/m.14705 type:complete len:113 (-) Transcript_6096:117-455(-)
MFSGGFNMHIQLVNKSPQIKFPDEQATAQEGGLIFQESNSPRQSFSSELKGVLRSGESNQIGLRKIDVIMASIQTHIIVPSVLRGPGGEVLSFLCGFCLMGWSFGAFDCGKA